MATKLTTPVTRETTRSFGIRPIMLTIAPSGAQNETLLGLRLKGKRTQYVCALSDVYRMAALWHGQKEAKARREARREGIAWKHAKRRFLAANSIPKPTKSRYPSDTSARLSDTSPDHTKPEAENQKSGQTGLADSDKTQ